MNVIKHMEAAFLFALGVAGAASVAIDAIPPARAAGQPALAGAAKATVRAAAPAGNSIATPTTMAVVKVSAKRMSALEKQRSLASEQAGRRI